MTEYVKHEVTGDIREVRGRWKNSAGQRYLWLTNGEDNTPMSYEVNRWEDYEPPRKPETGERWITGTLSRADILDHRDVNGTHVFAYKFETTSLVHIRTENDIPGWRKSSV